MKKKERGPYADATYGYALLAAEIGDRHSSPDLHRRPVEDWTPELGIDAASLQTLTMIDATSLLEAVEELEGDEKIEEVRRILSEVFATGWLAQRRKRNARSRPS